MRSLLPALLFLLPGVLGAQAATYNYINQKAPYTNPAGSPWSPWTGEWLTAISLPRIGTTFSVRIPRSFTYRSCGGCAIAGTSWRR